MRMNMSLGTVHIPDWARHMLSGAVISDQCLDLGTELDKDQFQVMHKIVLAMGGTWNKSVARFVFPAKADVEALVRGALAGREQPPAPPPNPAGRWDTPPELAHEIIAQARVTTGTKVLDFYAGNGHLTGLCIASGAVTYAVEPDRKCIKYLQDRMKGLRKLWHMEPGQWIADMRPYTEPRLGDDGAPLKKLQFRAIITHSPHEGLLDIGITRALWPFVGDTLVSVISAASWNSDEGRAVKFRAWCDYIAADVIPISDKMHHDYGELNEACLFVGEKVNG